MVCAMRVRILTGILALLGAWSAQGANVWTRTALMAAAQESASDNISSGWCGRGMLALLKSAGMANGLKGGNGQDWEQNLVAAGWKPIKCLNPYNAPLGAVLVYLGDSKLGKIPRGTPGGYFGHVEMVALGPGGQRLYVSDCPRVKPGGSVPDNFTMRAWMPPGMPTHTTPATQSDVDEIIQERYKMAVAYFDRSKDQTAATRIVPDLAPGDVKR
ncbi:hypothetical protein BH09VER1_BH09VER1_24070 [soil metagenome]